MLRAVCCVKIWYVCLQTCTTCRIPVLISHSQPFGMEFGWQLGCPLAPFMFNLFMDWVVPRQ